jgi:hypothetical protein
LVDLRASPSRSARRTIDTPPAVLRFPGVSPPRTSCPEHGPQGMGFACIHVASATKFDPALGFFWFDDDEMDRPWAWCASCENVFVASESNWDELTQVGDFKLVCAGCWDELKGLLYRPATMPSRP